MNAHFFLEVDEEAIQHNNDPEIVNTDLGIQFTSQALKRLQKNHDIRLIMVGKGSWRDNVFDGHL